MQLFQERQIKVIQNYCQLLCEDQLIFITTENDGWYHLYDQDKEWPKSATILFAGAAGRFLITTEMY